MCSLQEMIIVLISHAPKLFMDKTEAFKSQELQCHLLELCVSDPTNKILLRKSNSSSGHREPHGHRCESREENKGEGTICRLCKVPARGACSRGCSLLEITPPLTPVFSPASAGILHCC